MYLTTDMVCALITSNQNVKFVSTLKYVFDVILVKYMDILLHTFFASV